MAVPTGTFTKYAAAGIREDLQNMIYDVSAMDVPFTANIDRIKAEQTTHEWQTDVLASSSAVNKQLEGDDGNTTTAVATVRLANYCQISTKVPRVTGTLRAVNTAGRADELSYAKAKLGRELVRDIEAMALGTQAADAGSALTARAAAGVAAFLWDNDTKLGSAQSTVTVTSGAPTTAPTAGTDTAWSEGNLKANIALCWADGGNPGVIFTGPTDKQNASALSGIGTQYRDVQYDGGVKPGSIVGAADLYISDFGQHQIVANRFGPTDNVYILDMEYWCMAFLRPINSTELAKTGDSDRLLLLSECTLVAKNPASSGKLYTTTG